MALAVEIGDIERVREAVSRVAVHTPYFNSRMLTELVPGSRVVLKAENLQRTGSFKIRGVTAKLSELGDDAQRGIVAASAGNHAQAVAFGAASAGVSSHIFMPAEASIAKAEATMAYGASIHLEGESVDECLALAAARCAESGEILVHPFNDPAVIAGQGTLGLELIEDLEDLALVVVPLGGGGLAGGVAAAVKSKRPQVRVVAVQAVACAPYVESLRRGTAVSVPMLPTLADGIAVKHPGELTLPLIERYVDDVVTVGEDEIADAMVLLLERAKLVVEGAGAVGVAAVLAGAIELPTNGTTALVLSGGNVDTGLLAPAIRRHESNAGRRLVVFAKVPDRPGQLARLLTVLGQAGANVVTVEHLRDGYDLHVRETGLHVVLETRNRQHAADVIEVARKEGFYVEPAGEQAQVRLGGERSAKVK